MPRGRPARPRPAVAVALVALLLALTPALARADGDPASDVLVAQGAFVPANAGATAAAQEHLSGVLTAAKRAGYPLRVAVIASASDLGSVSALWRQPQAYAEFLGDELSLAAPGRVLVVMPGGFGLFQPGVTPAGDVQQLGRAAAVARNPDLAVVAADGVENLAASADRPISPASIVAPTLAGSATSSDGVLTGLAVIAGLALIAGAWTLSLRARPLQLREEH
jgi:hypothetical protein